MNETAGNISWLLEDEPLEYYLDLDHVIRTIPINFDASYVAGRIFMVTGTRENISKILLQTRQRTLVSYVWHRMEKVWSCYGDLKEMPLRQANFQHI